MQLKAPPERVALMADAIESALKTWPIDEEPDKLQEILTWLRYRIAKWKSDHPDTATG